MPQSICIWENKILSHLYGHVEPIKTNCICCSITKLCSTLCNSVDCSMPGFLVLCYLLEFAQIHVHWVGMPSNHLIPCCPFSSCPQSFPTSGPFPMSRVFASDGHSIGLSASASVLAMNIQGWSPLGLTGLNFSTDVLFQLGLALY